MTNSTKPTVAGTMDALTYAEESAIRRRFAANIEALVNNLTSRTAGRALYFAHLLMNGTSEDEAFKIATETPYGEVDAAFAGQPDELDEDDPQSDEGKAVSPSA